MSSLNRHDDDAEVEYLTCREIGVVQMEVEGHTQRRKNGKYPS